MTVNPGPGHEPGYDEYHQSGHTPPELRGAVERSHALDPFYMVCNPDLASDAPPIDFQGVWSRGFAACVGNLPANITSEANIRERWEAMDRRWHGPTGWGSPDAEPMADITDFMVGPAMLPRAPSGIMADLLPEAVREAMEREEQRWAQLLARLPEVTVTLEGFWDPELAPFLDPRADLVHPFTD